MKWGSWVAGNQPYDGSLITEHGEITWLELDTIWALLSL
jgi:hypothetical protein